MKMKKVYIAPQSEIVKICTANNIMEAIDIYERVGGAGSPSPGMQ